MTPTKKPKTPLQTKIPNQEKIRKQASTKFQQQVWDKVADKWNAYRTKPPKIVEDFLSQIPKDSKILDLGCGSGRNFKAFNQKNNLEIYAQDFSKEMLKHAKVNAKKLKLNIQTVHSPSTKIPFKDNFFDSIICIALLHCLTLNQTKKTLKELHRVLKPKSKALITVWSRNSKRLRNKPKESFITWTIEKEKLPEKQPRYTYIFEKQELESLLKKSGFKIIKTWEERNINAIIEK